MQELSAPAADVRDCIARLAVTLFGDSQLDALVGELNAELIAEVPAVGDDPAVVRDLTSSTRALLVHLLDEMAKDPAVAFEFPQPAVDFARTLAEHGHDVGQLLRLYRIGQRVFWRKVLDAVGAQIPDGELRMRVLAFLWEQSSRVLDHNLDVLAVVHSEASERRLRGALARRAETVQAILRGDSPPVEQASVQLGHNLHRVQTALVLWAPGDDRTAETSEQLESVALEAASAIGAERPLTIRADPRTVWAWLATGANPALGAVREARTLRSSNQLRVAVGVPAPGIDGFRSGHREALRAQAVAEAVERPEHVTYYADVEVLSCLSGDDEAIRVLVLRELRGLAARGPVYARLRETALAYLQAGGSARRAATELGVHKNTVLYRLRQVEDLLGHPVGERRLPTEVALLLAQAYGARILAAGGTANIPE